MARVRVRQHVNPLSIKYQTDIKIPEWQKIYSQPDLPLHLDIGCAWGRFLQQMASLEPQMNFLGVEIREALVKEANCKRDELGLTNLYYLFGNVNYSFTSFWESLPQNILYRVSIQFPDPWFKQRHIKRRVVQPELVETLFKYMVDGGIVFLQSDVEEVALEMCDRFAAHIGFEKQHSDWLENNPLPVATEREKAAIAQGQKIYRALFKKLPQ